jgi:MFS family permease
VPLNQVGKVASILLFFSFPGAIVGTFMTGYVFDILGRKWTLFISFLLGSILLAVIPQTSPSLTYLLIVRILLQMCFCAPASSPLPADYIHKESIGVGMTLNGVGLVMGQIFSMGVMFKVT